jgi:hypothetical protein
MQHLPASLSTVAILLMALPALAGAPVCGDLNVDNSTEPECQPPAAVDFDALYADLRAVTGQDALPAELQEAAGLLESRSRWFVARVDGLHVRSLHGFPLGSVGLASPLDPAAAYPAALLFLETYADLFRLTDEQRSGLTADFAEAETRVGDHVRIRLEQYHQGVRIHDGGFALRFLENGRLHSMWGSPYSALELPADVTPQISESLANATAIGEVAAILSGSPYATGLTAAAELVVEGATAGLQWSIHVRHPNALGVDYAVRIDALTGNVLAVVNDVDEGSVVQPIEIRSFRHKAGEKDDRTFPTLAQNPLLSTPAININTTPIQVFPGLFLCQVRLQRLGAGRARMWNGNLNTGTDEDPVFGYSSTWTLCPAVPAVSYFEQRPRQTFPFLTFDNNDQFNEQQVYVWAQRLKTQVDNWGRRQGQGIQYYPVVDGRDENFEIVVNLPASAEPVHCGSVMHGCVRNNCGSACGSWFQGQTSSPHIVFFFNNTSNSSSPQFVGTELSSTYSIVAHEVGHTISWQYGRPTSDGINARRSRSEGWSMAFPAVWGKSRWTSSLAYDESINVTTGGKAGTGHQWEHHTSSTLERYDQMDCEDANPYRLAWPWMQAMWEMANNRNEDTGFSIWTGSQNAVDNTGDFLMNSIYNLGDSNDATWQDVAANMYIYQFYRIWLGKEKGGSYPSWTQVVQILEHHGLLDECQ